MAIDREISRTITMDHRMQVTCTIPIPDVKADPSQAPAMGKCVSQKDEELEKLAEETLFPQGFRAIKRSVKIYEKADLPERLINGQKVFICAFPEILVSLRMMSLYAYSGDTMFFDYNGIIGLCDKPDGFFFGHEVGNKVFHIKNGKENLIRPMASILGIHPEENLRKLQNLMADEVGNIVSSKIFDGKYFGVSIEPVKRKEIQRMILQLIWQ